MPFLDHSPYLCSVLEDPRVVAINARIFGGRYNYLNRRRQLLRRRHALAFGCPAAAGMAGLPAQHQRVVLLYFDATTRATGALRVIPGSHRPGEPFADALSQALEEGRHGEQLGVGGADVPAVALETAPGDVLVFNNYLKHASFGGSRSRRLLVLNFSRCYPIEHRSDLTPMSYGARLLTGRGRPRMAQLYDVLEARERAGQALPLEETSHAAFLQERSDRANQAQ